MEIVPSNNNECILQKIISMKISLITEIFAYTSKFPFRFLFIISKFKKLNAKIEEILSNIDMEYNNLNKSTLSYIKKYKLAQKIYLPIIEKTIEQKILHFNFDFLKLDNSLNNIIDEENYKNVIYNNLKEELYEKYNSLKIYCNDLTYKNRNNKWFLEKISDKKKEYFNNCVFIINDILSIEIIIYLLYYNNYLNFKNNLKIKKIGKDDEIKLILRDENIKYILEYPRAIILNEKFIYDLLKSNMNNFYISSFENINRLYSIIYQRKTNNNNIIKYNLIEKENKKNMEMIINKKCISLKEINLYLKEYQSINAETIEFKNFSVESSVYDYFFSGSKYNNKLNINHNKNKDGKNSDLIPKFSKNNYFDKINNDSLELNFENDFFEINENNKINILHCSEIVNFINSSKNIINLYLFNFPLLYLKNIKNQIIEFIEVNNFFNLNDEIIFCVNEINKNLPKLKKIKINYSNYNESKEFTYIKRSNTNLRNIKLNLKSDLLIINNNLNEINLKEIYSYILSFNGIKKFNFGINNIQLNDKIKNDLKINMFLNGNNNNEFNYNILKDVDINILKYLTYDNLLIYGHILNGIKPIEYYIVDEKNNNMHCQEGNEIIKNINIFKLINTFSENNFSLIFKKDYFFLPFIENLVLKISCKKLQKLLSNCIFGKEVNLYNINVEYLYYIKNETMKIINIYPLEDENIINNSEYNLRYIYNNIPNLNCISINLFNSSIVFYKKILPFLCFKLKCKTNNNKKILIFDFGNNDEILYKMKDKNVVNLHSNNDIIFKFIDKEVIINKNIIKSLQIKNQIINIFIGFYILTLIIILYIIFISILS